MKVCWMGFLQNHSWGITGQNIMRAFKDLGTEIHLKSTNGYEHFPNDLKPYIKETLDSNYDICLSYTAPHNMFSYLNHGKNKFGIYNYEFTELPKAFAKYYKVCSQLLPSSNFSKDIFLKNHIPNESMTVVPHGINLKDFENKTIYPLKTKKKYKILINIAQPHLRKNLTGTLRAFGLAFDKTSDVALIAKVVIKNKKENAFDVLWGEELKRFKNEFPNHAEIEIINQFIPDLIPLYNACDILLSLSHTECFLLPGLEALGTNKLVISSQYGGQLDYLNDNNSLLVNGSIVRANRLAHYYEASLHSSWFEPDSQDAANKLKYAVDNYDKLMVDFLPNIKKTTERFTWENAVKQIIKISDL